MADIAVYHDDLSLRGGGEDVCMNVLDALCRVHDVRLFTRVPPDLAALNEYYDTAVSGVDVVTFRDLTRLAAPLASVGQLAERLAGYSLRRLQRAVFTRAVDAAVDRFDAVIDTSGQGVSNAIVYRHKPHPSGDEDQSRLGPSFLGLESSPEVTRRLANSEWTADELAARMGARPTVVYPPVYTADLNGGEPWAEREPGFVAVGRLSPEKNVLRSIDVVTALRDRGHDTHLHIVGPTHDAAYAERVRERADGEAVRYEGRVPRARLVELLRTHRYGIHGREAEHFGISVAEMVASGAVPFVPDSGGQREIIGGDERLTYDSTAGAVEKADRVLADASLAMAIRDGLPDVERRFGRERFRDRIRAVVEEEVGPSGGKRPNRSFDRPEVHV